MALESTRRSESSPEPGSQAERRLNSTLSIPFILPLTMRGAVGYESHASPRKEESLAVLKRTSLGESEGTFHGLSVSLKRRQAWLLKMNVHEPRLKAGSLELIL